MMLADDDICIYVKERLYNQIDNAIFYAKKYVNKKVSLVGLVIIYVIK